MKVRWSAALLVAGCAVPLSLIAQAGPSTGSGSPAAAAAAAVQSGVTTLTPQIVQAGATPASADKAHLSGTVSFRPAKRGRPVLLQRSLPGQAWETVSTLRQSRAGNVSFTGPARSGTSWYTYRGVAKRFEGLAPVTSAPQSASVWGTAPAFDEPFAGDALSERWSVRAPGLYSPESQRACSASSPEAVTVAGGRVELAVKADDARRTSLGPCNASHGNQEANRHWYLNGQISTAGAQGFAFQYGVAAARVKFARETGSHGSFWLKSTVADRSGSGPEVDGAEVDVVEYFGKNFKQGDIYTFVHYRTAADRTVKAPTTPMTAARAALVNRDDAWFKRYHVFSVEWTPKAYVFRVDGVQTLRLTQGVSQVPEFLILSMLSSDWELPTLDRATLPNATEIDWVRVWQQ